MPDIEIEIKVQIEQPQPLLKFLKKKAKLKSKSHQVDEYFIPAHRDFLATRPIKEWLRLRNEEGQYSVNYKNWHYKSDLVADFCDELETLVGDFSKMRQIFRVLDFKSIAIVDKIRESWQYLDYEISIDKVKKLGNFVEIEYKGKAEVNPTVEVEKMIRLLKETGCGKITRNHHGYPWLVLFPEEVSTEER